MIDRNLLAGGTITSPAREVIAVTIFTPLDLRLSPLVDAAREYTRPEVPAGMQRALIELVCQTFAHARVVLNRHLAALVQARTEMENLSERDEVVSKQLYSLADHVAGSIELGSELETFSGSIHGLLPHLDDTEPLIALMDECDQLRGRLVENCRQLEADYPELTALGLTDHEHSTVFRYDTRELAATCSPLCTAVAGSCGLIAFVLGGIVPAVAVGLAAFVIAAVVAEGSLRGTMR